VIDAGDRYFRLRSFDRPEEPEQIILKSQIWFSDVQSQDDIYEGRPRIEWPGPRPTEPQVRSTVSEQLRHLPAEHLEREIQAAISRVREESLWEIDKAWIIFEIEKYFLGSSICSFFPECLNARAWAQYAAKGTGYCLVFNFSKPWRFSATQKGVPIDMLPVPVTYTEVPQRPVINVSGAPSSPEQTIGDVRNALLTKSDQWAEQKEARLIRVGVPAGPVDFPSESLEGIIFGYGISRENRQRLLELNKMRKSPLAFYAVSRSHASYGLELAEYEPSP
jgi:hypothetical protein